MQVSSRRNLTIFIYASFALVLAGCGSGGGGGGGNNEPKPEPKPINRAPSITIVQPSSNPYLLDVTTAQYLDITIRADDPDSDKLDCVWTWDAGLVSPAEYTTDAGKESTVRFTPPNYDGLCTLHVFVSDAEANASAKIEIQVTGHNVQPDTELRILGISMTPDPAAPSATATLSATVDNPGGKTLTYTWKSKYGSFSGTGGTISWAAPSRPGVYGIYLTVSDGTISVHAGKAAMVAGSTGGLLGQYFKTIRYKNVVRLNELRLTRIDPGINFAWEKLSPDPEKLPGDGWGARWTGFVKCEEPGTYIFRVHVDDGARMRIQNDSGEWIWVIPDTSENWSDHTEGAWLPYEPIPLALDGGKWYPIELDYFEGGVDAFIRLYWSVNGEPETLVPQEAFRPPS